jgi:hypothetical protein
VFVEKNVRADQAALKELIDRGFQSTPVTLIDGEAVVGFDQDKLEKLLDLHAKPREAL